MALPLNAPFVKYAADILADTSFGLSGGKIASELMAINYGRNGFDKVVIVRPHNVYGPDMGFEHVIPQFALRLKRAMLLHIIEVQPWSRLPERRYALIEFEP